MNRKIIDKPKSNCGVVGVYDDPDASRLAYLALYSLQHRGQEAAGIVASDRNHVRKHVGQGLVSDVFSDEKVFDYLAGDIAIGHNRYSTTGATHLINTQTLLVNGKDGPFAISHNGNFTNSGYLRHKLESDGSIFQTTTATMISRL